MKEFRAYALELRRQAKKILFTGDVGNSICVPDILNGQPAAVLRDNVPLELRKQTGAFFTSSGLSIRLFQMLPASRRKRYYCDPACGAGDLLLAACAALPVGRTFADTIEEWGNFIAGFDIQDEFITATKARLVLLAAQKSIALPKGHPLDWNEIFPKVRKADGLRAITSFASTKNLVILLNPPYYDTQSPSNCQWAQGQVNSAALFVERLVSQCAVGTTIAAILPDVLRSGTRYDKWRELVQSKSKSIALEIADQFDPWTDVNVYLTAFTLADRTASKPISRSQVSKGLKKSVGDLFDVRVGAVVPHRDPNKGKQYPFIHAHDLPAWHSLKRIRQARRFAGTVFAPPFIAIRRTSRPGDHYRAIATIVEGRRLVAAENHLLILTPKSGTLSDCRKLMLSLKHPETTKWLDVRIRCRHLTVKAIREMPLF